MDKRIDTAIDNILNIADLQARAQIRDELIGLKDIAPDLIAPGDFGLIPVKLFHGVALLITLLFV